MNAYRYAFGNPQCACHRLRGNKHLFGKNIYKTAGSISKIGSLNRKMVQKTYATEKARGEEKICRMLKSRITFKITQEVKTRYYASWPMDTVKIKFSLT